MAKQASEELGVVDSTLDQVTNSLTRAHELAVQLGSDTYNATDRANGAVEVQQLMSAAVAQLNQRFGDRYIFGGMLDNAPPFDAAGNYSGDANAFKGAGGGTDILAAFTSLSTALSTNDATQIRASIATLADGIQQMSNFQNRRSVSRCISLDLIISCKTGPSR